MHHQTITVSLVVVAVLSLALLLPTGWTILSPTRPPAVNPSASHDVLTSGANPFGQAFEDLQGVTQRFADELGRLKETSRTISPATLAEQAERERGYLVTPTPDPGRKLDAETIYAQSKPGVVIVGGVYKCEKCQHWHAQCATGFVIRQDGLIVTNMHTIEAFKKLDAMGVMTDDGRVFPAKSVLAASRLDDLALLQVDAEHLQPLPVSNDVPVGAPVYCLSHPMMPSGKSNCFYTFSQGTVCGKFTIHNEKQQPLRVLAVTNDYGAGSSGGPILNEHGAVVAVVCQALPLCRQEKEKIVQMIWRFSRPSCSLLDMLSFSTAKWEQSRAAEATATSRSVREPPAYNAKVESSEPGGTTFALHVTDKITTGYYRPVAVRLSDRPPVKPKAEPAYRSKPLYGVLQLGDAEDNRILVALDEPEGGEPRIYIDCKADGDLANSGPGHWDRAAGPVLFAGNVTIDVPYQTGKIPYNFIFYRFKNRNHDNLYYYRNSGREGEVALDGRRYRVLVLDDNSDGRFDDLRNGCIIIDLNQDGTLEATPDSAEYFQLTEPFNVNGKVWEVASVSPDGLSITLRRSAADVAIKPYLTPGHPAPEFIGTGLDGRPIDLRAEAAKSRYVLLDFWASWCGPCRGEFPTLHRVYDRYKNHGLTIIGVTLDSEMSRRSTRPPKPD